MHISRMTKVLAVAALACGLSTARADVAGSIFLTGHDSDFHAYLGGNTTGAQDITAAAINFIMDPGFNPFVLGGINKFLFVESSITPPSGHTDGENGLIAGGYVAGTDYDRVDATGLAAALGNLGTSYSSRRISCFLREVNRAPMTSADRVADTISL